ncbi:F-box/kelch-repeat protein At2g43270 isoform X1 [Capsella rubella]|uniref:F-box/kelch-repeat protein At2g43270 isoform X1 n=1 Tax=Capsella rubella TaxID=81985 RepID=UPI000CD4E375|nr:F-box/kelch-repeat protein At2g43270 isoform X1 [Capsella rubella]
MQATKMVEEEKNTNWIYVSELLEEIFLRLPSKSILKFKTVSKQWRSILESKIFVERRMNIVKTRKIIAAYNCDCGDRPRIIRQARLDEADDEEIVYIHFGDSQLWNVWDGRPLMTCDGLVCIVEPESIIVLNPSTGQLLRFPSAPDPSSRFINGREGSDFFWGNWVMGFGRDKVTGSYKVAKMCFYPTEGGCDVLDVESGEWRNLRLYPYVVQVSKLSVCVSGSIYWLSTASYKIGRGYKILALDLHKQEFHYISVPDKWVSRTTHIANLTV